MFNYFFVHTYLFWQVLSLAFWRKSNNFIDSNKYYSQSSVRIYYTLELIEIVVTDFQQIVLRSLNWMPPYNNLNVGLTIFL